MPMENFPDAIDDEDAEHDDPRHSDSSDEDEFLIAKPPGEGGRPGRGGYTVAAAVRFNEATRRRISCMIKDLTETHLDSTKSYTGQKEDAIAAVIDEVRKKHPCLDEYKDQWPAHDMLKAHLKYSSSAARRERVRLESGDLD
ncbi:hypothetical protein PLICRDRAFT_176652 [Plicaturopsis crispa FD-325 SS-3]|nr:hypothetical protein PLICRDRAFT_176652 [Plicaturopsis crispa FD-325 SS-3]